MSIVERALRRLQNSRPAEQPRPPAWDRPVARPRETPVPVLPVPPPSRSIVPKGSLATSIETLRANGALPPAHQADVLADQFRRIKWPLLDSVLSKDGAPDARPGNAIMVTSSVAGEGKTFTSLNLALSIAREKDFSVLLIDADVAKRHATRVFEADERAGLTEILSDPAHDPEDLVLGTAIANLAFLPAGRRQELAPELFASQRMIDVIRQLAAADPRRVLLFDSSPLLATNESQVLARVVDQVVLVVRAESTTQPMVLEALNLLGRRKEIRCILNQASASELGEHYYGYGKPNANEPQKT